MIEKIKQLPKTKSKEEKKLFIKHFKERDISEKIFDKTKIDLKNINKVQVFEKDINSKLVEKFIKK